MKNRRLLPLLVSASLFSALGFSALPLPSASAQPTTAKKGKKAGAKAMKGGVSKKMLEKIETQMGKPLTADQKTRLDEAYRARTAATKAANAKFADEIATVTGLTADQVTQMNKRGPRAAGADKPAGA